ncbi:hypothetical protein HHL22_03100 [Hymenobacter sp. RP-2-7]|uniref:Uncharacterized protein n=1 Tax=Hymenobacter polaris TaxID=2682546 RepID=A0A7Y0FLA9_9BACT|nr:hypothetical protein [Hymenobacter polaris]NML64184.1 hypothetical protein [Hymenobacter polaris]
MKKLFLAVMLTCFSSLLFAQEIKPIKQNLTFNIDNLGDGHIELAISFTAAQWDNFKRVMGNNTDLLKRQMERTLPSYYLQNFAYKEDAMNRSYVLSFDALGMAKVNDDGLWQLDLDMKKPDITKLSDNVYTLTSNYNAQGALIQQVAKVVMPAAGSDFKQGEDSFGKAIFTYSLSPDTHGTRLLLLVLGVLLVAAGLAWHFVSARKLVSKNTQLV